MCIFFFLYNFSCKFFCFWCMKGFLVITIITRVSGLASAFSPNYLVPFFAYCLLRRYSRAVNYMVSKTCPCYK